MHFSSGDFHVKVINQIRDEAGNWDDFHGNASPLHSRYLLALESAHPADMEFRYVFIYKDKLLVSSAYLQLVNYSEKNFSGNGSIFTVPLLKLFFKLKKVRLLFCGNLFSLDYPCLHFQEEYIAFEEVIAAIQKINALEKCQLLMLKEMNLPAEKIHILEQNGFRKYGEDMTMKLDVKSSWKSFDDYFNSLTKKYRKRLKVIRQSKQAISLRKIRAEELDSFLPRIGELFRKTAARQFLKMGIIDEKYFAAMQEAYGEKFYINGYFLNDNLIAFASHIIHSDNLEVHYIGIDYAYNETYSLYFNILYDGVEMAIASNMKSLELGRTAREAKACVGCKPSPSFDYLFVSNKFTNFLIGVFEKLFLDKMGDEWKNRNPFKLAEKKE